MKKNITSKHVLVFIIVLQALLLIWAGTKKRELFIDEVYSYVLSNSYDFDMISNADYMWGEWVNTDDFMEFITVQPGEEWSLEKVYYNNTTDCHPPLYYWILHSVCSFFPNQFNFWFGLAINLILYILNILFLYFVTNEIFYDSKYRYAFLIMYGCSPVAIDDYLFIRMYMLITLFVSIFIYIQCIIINKGICLPLSAATWGILYLGAMTHYYFTVFAFWAVLIFILLELIRDKRITRNLIYYSVGSLLSVLLMLLSYPAAIIQATGSSTNRVGSEVMGNIFNFKLWAKAVYYLGSELLKSIYYSDNMSLVVTGIILLLIIYKLFSKDKQRILKGLEKKKKSVADIRIWLICSFIFSFFSISFIGGSFAYLRYLYHIIPIYFMIGLMLLETIESSFPRFTKTIIMVSVLITISGLVRGIWTESLYGLHKQEFLDDCLLRKYNNNSLIVITPKDKEIPTGNLIKFSLFNNVYMDTESNIFQADVINKTLEEDKECIIFIDTDEYWTDGYKEDNVLKEIQKNRSNNNAYSIEYLCSGHLGKYYVINLSS